MGLHVATLAPPPQKGQPSACPSAKNMALSEALRNQSQKKKKHGNKDGGATHGDTVLTLTSIRSRRSEAFPGWRAHATPYPHSTRTVMYHFLSMGSSERKHSRTRNCSGTRSSRPWLPARRRLLEELVNPSARSRLDAVAGKHDACLVLAVGFLNSIVLHVFRQGSKRCSPPMRSCPRSGRFTIDRHRF